MPKTYIIDGHNFHNLDGFYNTIYRLMTLYDDWYPAHNLDALNDMLYSGFGKEHVTIIWTDADKSRTDLGLEATQHFYRQKIDYGKSYNVAWAEQQLHKLENGTGKTLFDIILEIIADHKNIQLVLQ